MAAASCVLGHTTTTQEDHLDSPPGSQTRSEGLGVLGGLRRHHSEMELARKANKISLHLSLKPAAELVCVMGFSVVLFVCLFGLEPADTQHGVVEGGGGWRVRGGGGGVKGAKERRLRGLRVEPTGCLMRTPGGPPLEPTSDLPRSYGLKLLHKYTQTSGSGQQRPSAASDPSADFFLLLFFFSVTTPRPGHIQGDDATNRISIKIVVVFFYI